MLTYTDVCADVLCSRLTGQFGSLEELTAQVCQQSAEMKQSAVAVAAKGEACFGTAGFHLYCAWWNSKENMHNSPGCSFCLLLQCRICILWNHPCCSRMFVATCCWTNCRMVAPACLALALAVSWAAALRFLSGCVRKTGETDRETHCVRPTHCMVTDCVRVGTSVCVRVMDCMCFYQEIRAWLHLLLEPPRWRYPATSQPSSQLLLLLWSSRLPKCT